MRAEARRVAGELAGLDSERRREALRLWDKALKARGINPGACADLTVATLFAASLLSLRDERLAAPAQQ